MSVYDTLLRGNRRRVRTSVATKPTVSTFSSSQSCRSTGLMPHAAQYRTNSASSHLGYDEGRNVDSSMWATPLGGNARSKGDGRQYRICAPDMSLSWQQ